MQVIDKNMPTVTLMRNDETIQFNYTSYEEFMGEITIRTNVRESKIRRGWIGDLKYSVPNGEDIKTGEVAENTEASQTYKEVLLSKVNVYTAQVNEPTVWEYTFLKK